MILPHEPHHIHIFEYIYVLAPLHHVNFTTKPRKLYTTYHYFTHPLVGEFWRHFSKTWRLCFKIPDSWCKHCKLCKPKNGGFPPFLGFLPLQSKTDPYCSTISCTTKTRGARHPFGVRHPATSTPAAGRGMLVVRSAIRPTASPLSIEEFTPWTD